MKTYKSYLAWFSDQLEIENSNKEEKNKWILRGFIIGSGAGLLFSYMEGINPFEIIASVEGIATIVLTIGIMLYLYLKEEEIDKRKKDLVDKYRESLDDVVIEKLKDKIVDSSKIESYIEDMIKAKLTEVVKYPKITDK